jgi:EmrB/QacA subfamily drug resistance transporter
MSSTSRAGGLHRGAILALVCGAGFMVSLDIAVVNVALPSIQADLGVAQSDLQWVVITYGLLLGGSLLLGGRAADLFGRRRMLALGMTLFTAASLGAALSDSLAPLVAFRGIQGFGGALSVPAAISILASTFTEGAERNKALALFGAAGGSAASIGVMMSGILTSGPGWRWIFLINLPIGVAMVALVLRYIPRGAPTRRGQTDVLGAITVTAGLMAVVYAINKSVDNGWTSRTTSGFLAAGIALLALFVAVERRSASPLVPLGVFRRRTLTTANVVAVLAFGGFFATIFQASLFMQQVLQYSALRTGLAYLAIAGTAVVIAAGIAARVVGRLGAGVALAIGQAISAVGMLLLARAPADAAYWTDLFPGFVAVGVGIGFAGMAAQVAAFIGVEEHNSGLAGGIIETSREIGGALGTAIVATAAIARADEALARLGEGATAGAQAVALAEGFQRGALVVAGINVAAALAAGFLLRPAERAAGRTNPADPAPDTAAVPVGAADAAVTGAGR